MSTASIAYDPTDPAVADSVRLRRISPATAGYGVYAGAAVIGVTALVAVLLGDEARRQFAFSYLLSLCFFLSITLGALFFVMIQHLTRAGWSVVVRRLAENVTQAFLPLGVLFLPILLAVALGNDDLYPWVTGERIPAGEQALLAHKVPYLNRPFFLVRGLVFFAAWIGLARFFYRHSTRQDEDGNPQHTIEMQKVATWGIAVFALTLTFAAIDWIMTLYPVWFSTMWGVYFFAAGVFGFYAVLPIYAMILQSLGKLKPAVTVEHYHDIGKLLFGFMCFWAYIAFSQYFLIWYANVPEETVWYAVRQSHGWQFISLLLVAGHFAIPFLGMMSRWVKRSRPALFGWAAAMLVMHWLDMYWMIMPNLHDKMPWVGPFDVVCLLGVGLVVVATVVKATAAHNLLPVRDPWLKESLAFHNF